MTEIPTSADQLRTASYAVPPSGEGSTYGVYVLQQGETLGQVAQKFGITPETLFAVNPQLMQQLQTMGVVAGLRLNIPVAAPPPSYAYPVQSQPVAPPVPSGLQMPNAGVSMRAPYVPEAPRSFYNPTESAAPPPIPITWPRPLRALQLGLKPAPDIETLQRGLARIGYTLRVDGNFAGATYAAVSNFQGTCGMSPTGVMDGPTWMALMRAANSVRQPTQIVVMARREQFGSQDERNAYDIMVALAYDNPGQARSASGEGYGLRELMRLCGVQVTEPVTITPEAVTAFATKAMQAGLPLNEQSLAPLRALQVRGYNKPTYHEAKALGDFFVRVLPGHSSIDNHRYDALISATARQYGVPPSLVKAVMSAESSFDPTSYSNKDAQGLMQVLPDTAAYVGVYDISTPQANVLAGVRYLSYLLRNFNGDLINTIAGYNAGPNAILKNGGVPPYQETMDYVRRVLVNYTYYQQHPPYALAA